MKPLIICSFLFTTLFLHGRVFGQAETPNFYKVVQEKFKGISSNPSQDGSGKTEKFDFQKLCPTEKSLTARKVLKEYGAIFIVENVALGNCILSEELARDFQEKAQQQTERIGGIYITLQIPAMKAFLKAREEAAKLRLAITPRGKIASKRTYQQTHTLWNSRFFPALNYWTRRGEISRREAEQVKTMPINQQVEQVLRWEEKGLYFSKDFSKSILYSVAVPGASQHIFMLALDIQQYSNPRVRDILAQNGWFQTVKSDAPHFTYLGVANDPEKLRSLGLKSEMIGKQEFWIPDVD